MRPSPRVLLASAIGVTAGLLVAALNAFPELELSAVVSGLIVGSWAAVLCWIVLQRRWFVAAFYLVASIVAILVMNWNSGPVA